MPETNQTPRKQERIATELAIKVTRLDGVQPVSSESVILKDISGGGVCFFSNNPELYCISGKVSVDIDLPGPGNSLAHISGMGTVVWIGADNDCGGRTSIGISMDDLLSFDRFIRKSGASN